jgi:hypothetical protein
MRIRIETDDGTTLGEFVTLRPSGEYPPDVVLYQGTPYQLRPERCRAGEPPVYREPAWSIVEPIGWGCG